MASRADKGRAHKRMTKAARAGFLAGLRAGLSLEGAARAVGRDRRGFYALRYSSDPATGARVLTEFGRDVEEAIDQGTDLIEDEALRRGVEGWDEPVYARGAVAGVVRRYDSTLLLAMLNARRPDKYRRYSKVEHSGSQKVEVTHRDAIDVAIAGLLADMAGRSKAAAAGKTPAGAVAPPGED